MIIAVDNLQTQCSAWFNLSRKKLFQSHFMVPVIIVHYLKTWVPHSMFSNLKGYIVKTTNNYPRNLWMQHVGYLKKKKSSKNMFTISNYLSAGKSIQILDPN